MLRGLAFSITGHDLCHAPACRAQDQPLRLGGRDGIVAAGGPGAGQSIRRLPSPRSLIRRYAYPQATPIRQPMGSRRAMGPPFRLATRSRPAPPMGRARPSGRPPTPARARRSSRPIRAKAPARAPPAGVSYEAMRDPTSNVYQRYGWLNPAAGPIRAQILARAARGVGIRLGLPKRPRASTPRSRHAYAVQLDARYDFRTVMIGQSLVPPVITEIRRVGERGGDRLLYLTLGAFEIVKPARLTLSPPTWRDYLRVHSAEARSAAGILPQDPPNRSLGIPLTRPGSPPGSRRRAPPSRRPSTGLSATTRAWSATTNSPLRARSASPL